MTPREGSSKESRVFSDRRMASIKIRYVMELGCMFVSVPAKICHPSRSEASAFVTVYLDIGDNTALKSVDETCEHFGMLAA